MAEKTYQRKQLLLLINQILIIAYLGYEYLYGRTMRLSDIFPLVLISIIVADAIYIGHINIKESKLLSTFSNLLVLISWCFFLSLDGSNLLLDVLSITLTIMVYFVIQFVLTFFFQGSAYTFQKQTDTILKISCLITLICKFITNQLFALFFLIQVILGAFICMFLFGIHRKRIQFVLKSEWKNLLYSALLVVIIFFSYVMYFGPKSEYIENLGTYLVVFLPLFSIHSIAFKNFKERPATLVLDKYCRIILFSSLVGLFVMLILLIKLSIAETFIIFHCFVAVLLLFYILLYSTIRQSPMGKYPAGNNFFTYSMRQIKKEEELRLNFSNYLHDDILQDLLSIKNMMSKSEQHNIKEMILQTLDKLNISIRGQMQDYHPAILKTLTLKENLQNLIVTLNHTYPTKNFNITFNCDDKLFLVEPYNLITYRILKELVTNAIKHSHGSWIKISLLLNKENVNLFVEDNGVGISGIENCFNKMHKGLNSIQEQLALIEGTIEVDKRQTTGACISVRFPMKGDNSYAYFIDR